MNYKLLIIEKLKEFTKKHPEMSMSEILYSIQAPLRALDFNNALLETKDEKLYTYIEIAIKKEGE